MAKMNLLKTLVRVHVEQESRVAHMQKIFLAALCLFAFTDGFSQQTKMNVSKGFANTELQEIRSPSAEMPSEHTANILYIGDSHSVGYFGAAMNTSLRQLTLPGTGQFIKMKSVATCGSASSSWLNPQHSTSCGFRICNPSGSCQQTAQGTTVGLQQLLTQAGPSPWPQITIIALGTNMLKSNIKRVMADVTTLIQQVRAAGSSCIWVGPPRAKESFVSDQQYNEFIQNLQTTVTLAACQYIDSSQKTNIQDIAGDGIHYKSAGGTAWGQATAEEIKLLIQANSSQK